VRPPLRSSGSEADEDPDADRIVKLRAEIVELGSTIRQLQHTGLDDAAAQLLIARKRALLEGLVRSSGQARRGTSAST
jgi:hypothetical protein